MMHQLLLKSLDADEERLTRELQEMPSLDFLSSRSSGKGTKGEIPQRKSQMTKTKVNEQPQIDAVPRPSSRAKSTASDSREERATKMVGRSLPCAPSVTPLASSGLLQERVSLPWENQSSKFGSEISSTASVGSTSMGTRPKGAGSDVSSSTWSAALSGLQGSDAGSPSRSKAATSVEGRRKPIKSDNATSRSPSNPTSAMDIAAMCWKEFEGALQP